MNISLVILFIAFLLILFGFFTQNHFFTLAGGFILLLSGILFLSNPLSYDDGYIINETDDNITRVEPVKKNPPGLLNHSFNLILVLGGMAFMWSSYIKLREQRYADEER